ncbi:MAG: tyrosine recombinase XerC [Sumerlaeia bacterium]
MKLSSAIDDFLRHVRIERGLSPHTHRAYQLDLRKLLAYLQEVYDPEPRAAEVRTLWLKDFLAHLRDERDYRPRSLSRMMSTLRVFFAYCLRQEWVAADPAVALHNPKIPKHLPVFLVEREIRRLLEPPADPDPIAQRDHAMLVLFVFSGMRLSELVGLNLRDLDFTSMVLRVRGKGNKERLLPLHREPAVVVRRYIRDFRRGAPGEEACFLGRDEARITPRAVSYAVEKAVQRAGLSQKITPHKLRHTFATQLLHNGASLIEIKELLGHSHVVTTSIYTHTNVARLRGAVEKLAN